MSARYVNRDDDPLKQLTDRVSGRIGAALKGDTAAVTEITRKG